MKFQPHCAYLMLMLLYIIGVLPQNAFSQKGGGSNGGGPIDLGSGKILLKGKSVRINNKNYIYLRLLPNWGADITKSDYITELARFKTSGYTIEKSVSAGKGLTTTFLFTNPDSTKLLRALEDTLLSLHSEASGVLYGALYDKIDTTDAQVDGIPIQINPVMIDEETEQRYAMIAIGAEASFYAAQLAGLAFIDSNATDNMDYSYSIVSGPANGIIPSELYASIAINNTPIVNWIPETPIAEFGDKKVALSWCWFKSTIGDQDYTYQNAYSS